ncbi:PorV/PorQ family protein, partial [bacterium]
MRKTKMKIILVSIICVSCVSISMGNGRGTTSGLTLTMSPDVRGEAMGSAQTGVAKGARAIHWNAAGLAGLKKGKEVNLMYSKWIEDINRQAVLGAYALKRGTLGFGIHRISMGEITKTEDLTGAEKGTYNPNDTIVMVGYAEKLKYADVGITAKYLRSEIESVAQTLTFDIGAKRKFLEKKLSVGIALQNIIGNLKYHEEKTDLPRIYKAGCGYKVRKNVLVTMDIGNESERGLVWGIGGEYKHKRGKQTYSVRAGYNNISEDISSGIRIGLGMEMKQISVDYAYVPLSVEEFGDSH